MENHYYAGNTLIGQQAFAWTRHENGLITVHDSPSGEVRAKMSARQYDELLDLLISRKEGVCLDVLNIAEPIPDYLGWLFKSFAMPRSHASWLVAIAVEEGFVELEQRGSHFKDCWLVPVGECGVRVFDNQKQADNIQSIRAENGAEPSLQDSLMKPIAEGVAADCRKLAQQAAQTHSIDDYHFKVPMEHLREPKKAARIVTNIMEWEQDVWRANHIYSLGVADKGFLLTCRDASARARLRNIGKRRFSHVNGKHHDSRCLYVGGSRTLSSRMNQHLGRSHPGVYAMQLAQWQSDKALEGNIVFHATRFHPNTDVGVLRAFEDKLWRMERPLFGRMGGR